MVLLGIKATVFYVKREIIIKDILEMDTNTITNIARQGRFTAEQYTDSIVAQKYIQCVTQ